jgi:hypothetical protein
LSLGRVSGPDLDPKMCCLFLSASYRLDYLTVDGVAALAVMCVQREDWNYDGQDRLQVGERVHRLEA